MKLTMEPLSGRDLAAFVAAVETGSIQGAAEALALTQSAATKRIQALERRVGAQLLDRGRTGVRPTATGRRAYPAARRALDALGAVEDIVTDREHPTRTLRIAASQTIGALLLPGWLMEFRRHDPHTQPQVEVVNSPGVTRGIRDGRVEIGFVEGLDDLRGLRSVTVGHDDIVAAVDAHHRWAARARIQAAELADEPYVTRELGSGTRAVAAHQLAKVGIQPVPIMEVASLEAVKQALKGGGFTLISRLAVETEVRSGSLHTLEIQGVDLTRQFRAIARRHPALGGPAAAFWRWLETAPDAAELAPLRRGADRGRSRDRPRSKDGL